MENKIDQFFKDKIENHPLPPSQDAWNKVEASLSKKNKVAVWRIAAAVLLTGALISLVIWSQQDSVADKSITETDASVKDNSIKDKAVPQSPAVANKIESKSSTKSSVKTVSPKINSRPDQIKREETENLAAKTQTTIPSNDPTVAIAANNNEEKINAEATQAPTVASTKQKPIKLEFTLDDYSSEQSVATVSEEKSSGFKKVWNLAREVKNGDGPVREIKNELFALNFKKNKTAGNSK
jgi:hypothetical protein